MIRIFKTTAPLAAMAGTILLMVVAVAPCALAQMAGGGGQPASVCIQCHSGLPDRLGAPVNLWRKSIHAQNGISCSDCHGGDARDAANAMSPARGFLGAPKDVNIPAFCGRCHVGVMNDYLSSAHGRALGKGGPTCVTCHSNHQVLKASLDLINERTCTQCHSFERAKAMKAAMQQTEGYIINIEGRISDLQSVGVDTEEMAHTLFAERNRFHTLFHDVDVARVQAQSAQINANLGIIDKKLKTIEDTRARRKIAGGIAVFCVLLIAVLVHMLRKTYE